MSRLFGLNRDGLIFSNTRHRSPSIDISRNDNFFPTERVHGVVSESEYPPDHVLDVNSRHDIMSQNGTHYSAGPSAGGGQRNITSDVTAMSHAEHNAGGPLPITVFQFFRLGIPSAAYRRVYLLFGTGNGEDLVGWGILITITTKFI